MKPKWTAIWNERILNEHYPQIRTHKVNVYICMDNMPCAVCEVDGIPMTIPKQELEGLELIIEDNQNENTNTAQMH